MSRTMRAWEAAPQLPSDHYVSSDIYTDKEVFELEIDRIFSRQWKFVCHESELPEKGDYRSVNHAEWPLVIHRGVDGIVRAFLNVCSHRSALVATAPRGNAKTLTCFFHLWGYDSEGDCVHITKPDGYADCKFVCKENMGLREVKCAVRLGMIFVNMDDEAEEFDSFVGDAFTQLEEVMGSVPLETFHLHRVQVNGNWKQWQETNMELYHEWGHVVNRTTSIMAKKYHERKWYIHPNGHGWLEPFKVEYKNYEGWDQRDALTLPGLTPGEFRVVDLFPNTTIIVRGTVVRIDTTIPVAPGLTILEQRGLGVKGESAEDRRTRQQHHNQFWGPLGRNLSEDVIFVDSVALANKRRAGRWGIFARHENMMSQDDEIMRAYYTVWSKMMGRPASNPLGLDLPTAAPAKKEGESV